MVGNDIVDLEFFERPFYKHIHYLDRVCAPAEAQAVRGSEHPVRSLGMIWACKEAAFKSVSSEWNLQHFEPRKFVTDFSATELLTVHSVHHEGIRINISLSICDRWLHALATFPGNVISHWRVREITGCQTNRAAPEIESRTARNIAEELLFEEGFENIVWADGARVPRFARWLLDARPDISFSLSHHGSYAAAAIACSSRAVGQEPSGWELGEECSTCIA